MFEVWFPNLNIKIQSLNRVAFSIFGIDIYWYGILISLSIFLALVFIQRDAKKIGEDPSVYSESLIYGIIFSLIFARAYYVIFSWDYFKNHLNEILFIRNGGIAIYGAIIGGAITIFIFTKIKKLEFFKLTDTVIPGLLIGQIIGRWGNFVNREAFGGYTNSLFAMRYLKEQARGLTPDILKNIVTIDGVEYIQVHPTFLYESLWNTGIFILILIYRKHKKFNGEITAIYFILYGIGRFWIEGLRTDALTISGTQIAISQLLSLVLSISFAIFFYVKYKNNK